MTIAHDFQYFKPDSLDEAVRLLGELGPRAIVLAGGTDVVGWMRDGMLSPDALVDIKGIPGLSGIAQEDHRLYFGALVTFNELIESPIVREHAPVIAEMARVVASTGVRNRATVVGNLCSSVPCCDAGPVLLAYDAVLVTRGPAGERQIPITEWFVGPRKTALVQGEIVTGIRVPLPSRKHAGCYAKLRRYAGEDLAQASVAVLALADASYRVAFGAVAPRPIRASRIERVLKGRTLDASQVREAIELIPDCTSPISDVRASREYRAHMLGVMLERALAAASARLSDTGPAYGTEVL